MKVAIGNVNEWICMGSNKTLLTKTGGQILPIGLDNCFLE
jgi:hypothetical protein